MKKITYQYKGVLQRVVDGDTLDVTIDMGFAITTRQRIRLAKVDTAEIFRVPKASEAYREGIKAKEYVEKRLQENPDGFIIETLKQPGKYGRYIGEIFLPDSDISLNDELLQKGLAKKWPH